MALARVKNWIAEVLTYSDLNAEFNNLINNANALISPFTANVAAGGFKITGLGAGTARTDAASLATIQDGTGIYVATVGGTADAITLTPSPAITAYAAGQAFYWIASGANTTAVTVAVSGIASAKNLTKNGTTALVAGDIASGALVGARYDGTRFQLVSVYAAGIANALLTTTGDIIVASAASTPARYAATATATAHATTMDPWVARVVTLSGSAVTFTDIADADYIGQEVLLIMNAAHIWTDGAVFDVQGGATYTTAAGDWVLLVATAVDAFDVTILRADGLATKDAQSTFTIGTTGFSADPSGTAAYSITNNVVTLYIPPLTGTSDATSFTLTGLPAAIRPTTAHNGFMAPATNNTTLGTTPARIDVLTDGTCNVFLDASGAVWTGSGTKALQVGVTITYNLN